MNLATLHIGRLRIALACYSLSASRAVLLACVGPREIVVNVKGDSMRRYLLCFSAGAALAALGYLGWIAFLFAAGAR